MTRRQRNIFLIFIFIFIALGIFFFELGEKGEAEVSRTITNDTVCIKNDKISFRVIGDDYCIEELKIPVADYSKLGESDIYIYLTKGEVYPKGELLTSLIINKTNIIDDAIVCNVSSKKLVYDRDYYCTLELENANAELILYKASDVSIGDGIYDIAYNVTIFRNDSMVMFIWKMVALSIVLPFAISAILKIRFWKSIGLLVIVENMLLYLMSLADLIKYVVYVDYILAGAVICGFIIYLNIKPSEIKLDQEIFSQLICWIILMVILFLHDKNMQVYCWDEGSHWATVVKNMYIFDSMYIHPKTTVTALRYPPLLSLNQFLMLKIRGVYSAGMIHFGKHFFETALLLFVFDKKHINNIRNIIYPFIVITIIIVPDLMMGAKGFSYNSLYADISLGIVFAAVLIQYTLFQKNSSMINWLLIVFLSVILMLTKDNGMILLASLIGGVFAIAIYEIIWEKKKILTHVIASGGLFLGFIFARVTFELYVNLHLSECDIWYKQQTSTIDTIGINKEAIFDYLTGKAPSYQYAVIKRHIWNLLFETYYTEYGISLSFAVVILILLVILCLMWKIFRWQINDFIKNIILLIFSTGSLVGIYHLVYTFTMSESEALALSSEPRYLGSYLIGIAFWVEIVFLDNVEKIENIKIKKIVIGCCILCIGISGCARNFLSAVKNGAQLENNLELIAESIRTHVTEDDRVFYLSSGEDGYCYVMFQYYLTPLRLNQRIFTDQYGKLATGYIPRVDNPEMYEYELSVKEFEEMLSSFDYVYIQNVDSVFVDDYRSLFIEPTEIDGDMLYQVIKENDTNKLLRSAKLPSL